MIDINLIRNNRSFVEEKLSLRGEKIDLSNVIFLDEQKRKLQQQADILRNRRKNLSEEIGKLKKENKQPDNLLKEIETLKLQLEEIETKLKDVETQLTKELLYLPNIPDDSVPYGTSQKDNKVVYQSGEVRQYNFDILPHWEIGKILGILDFDKTAKISGSRFVALKNLGAKLERAIINFMVEEHIKNGYEEIWLPYLVTKESITGTGQLPKFEEELYKCKDDDLYLIPTAEVTLVNLHKDEFIPEDELPKKYVSYSACFRREAGSYGKDIKGLMRLHQFNKIELVKFTKPEDSDKELELLVKDAAKILEKLGLTYRIVLLCSGDLGFASSKTYDLEVWMPAEKQWREISSCSNCKDFQSRRLNIKIKYKNGKKDYVHTLNGSGLAVGRTLACVLETYQQKDATLKIPDVLVDYFGKTTIP
ncbi:MAG: serine--tRNA ligase [Endomicrobiia bacterium]